MESRGEHKHEEESVVSLQQTHFLATKTQKTVTGATIRSIVRANDLTSDRNKTHIAAFPSLVNPELIRPISGSG
ncbi:hypothetical protein ACJIZ3_015189 [Penstemon smallii]|uniref:Uncharacterized protein n=1 Tax=Penstemon smallii TaxID=265156 RepID=A0ABD3RPU5_9LAMI